MTRPAIARAPFIAVALIGPGGAAAQDVWLQFGADGAHTSRAAGEPGGWGSPAWIATTDEQGAPVVFVHQAAPVADALRVVVLGHVAGEARVLCYDAASGACLWSSPIDEPEFDSWSSPAIDAGGAYVVVASGWSVRCLDAMVGAELWAADLDGPVVNASPTIAEELSPARRVFITDYSPFDPFGRLYAINLDLFDSVTNPFTPGQIVWSVPIGAASGNTPACAGGRVFVSTVGDVLFGEPGAVLAYDAAATSTPSPIWQTTGPGTTGFFSGLSVRETRLGASLYAASYNFFGSDARLVKLDAGTGGIVWAVPCERTSTTPVPIAGGVIVSGGIDGFGSIPGVRLYAESRDGANVFWSTSDVTLATPSGDAGGWLCQPALVGSAGGSELIVGSLPTGGDSFGPSPFLTRFNTLERPGSPAFIGTVSAAGGGAPAVVGGRVYSIGASGLTAFARTPSVLDVDGDGVIGVDDLYAWDAGVGARDVDQNGSINAADRAALEQVLRRNESGDMRNRRR